MGDAGSEEVVLSETSGGVMTITLNRPERGNGWTGQMSRAYLATLDGAARCPDVRAIIVTGAGKAFCVGGDTEILGDIAGTGEIPRQDPSQPASPSDHLYAIRVGKPIIAAVNGACFGIGMQQALCCDVRFASDDAKFATAFARRGLAAEMAMSWLLPRLVGTGHAMDLLLSARLVRAPEAERIGLVNRVIPAAELMDEARAYALELAEKCAPSAMRTIKAQAWRDMMSDLFSSYDRSGELMQQTFTGDDFKEGLASWQEGRPPSFPPLPEDEALINFDWAK
ncbi:MAG: enoyl-CoA hydratase-related protein [Novosphingobium sp.]|nr:enoyl-CoA hydratase-related protein [Novosphingobium sp.]